MAVFGLILVLAITSQLVTGEQDNYATRNLDTIRSLYNLTVYPHNIPIIEQGSSAVPPGIFAEDVAGRITPVGNFTSFEDSIEYFYGLAPVPSATRNRAFFKAEIVEFSSGCPNVAASVAYLHSGRFNLTTGELFPGEQENSVPLKQIAFWRFDAQGRVVNYDAWIPNIDSYQRATGIVNDQRTVTALCAAIQTNCQGAHQQYESAADCVSQLNTKPFGQFDETWGDNVACRIIHVVLTRMRPEAHCPHVGPKGGEGPDNYKCVDIDYVEGYFNDDKKLFGSPFNAFSCS